MEYYSCTSLGVVFTCDGYNHQNTASGPITGLACSNQPLPAQPPVIAIVAMILPSPPVLSGIVTGCSTVLIVLKHYTVLMLHGKARFQAGSRPPEDISLSLAKSIGKGKPQQFTPREDIPAHIRAKEMRLTRLLMNDLENIPLGLTLMWASQLGGAAGHVHSSLVAAFVAGRFIHTWAYVNERQPHRGYAWFVAVLANVGMALNLCAAQF